MYSQSDCVVWKLTYIEIELQINIKFCYKLRKTAAETYIILVYVYGTDAGKKKCMHDWFKRFRKKGKETVDYGLRSGRPQQV